MDWSYGHIQIINQTVVLEFIKKVIIMSVVPELGSKLL